MIGEARPSPGHSFSTLPGSFYRAELFFFSSVFLPSLKKERIPTFATFESVRFARNAQAGRPVVDLGIGRHGCLKRTRASR
jgi:hypothetical protein